MVHRNRSDRQVVVILQSDALSELGTRLVAPLDLSGILAGIGRLRPQVDFEGNLRLLVLDRSNVIAVSDIAEVLGSAKEAEERIKRGLDLLYFGI